MSRIWVKLDATYTEDDAICAVGPLAELLYIRALTYCRRRVSDGFIPTAVVPVIAAQIPADAFELADALVREELWLETEGGFLVRSWAEWQVTTETLKAESERKKLARQENRIEKNRRQPSDVRPLSFGRPADTQETPAWDTNRREISGLRDNLRAVNK